MIAAHQYSVLEINWPFNLKIRWKRLTFFPKLLSSFLLLVIVAFVLSFCLLFFPLFSFGALFGDLMLKQHKCIGQLEHHYEWFISWGKRLARLFYLWRWRFWPHPTGQRKKLPFRLMCCLFFSDVPRCSQPSYLNMHTQWAQEAHTW